MNTLSKLPILAMAGLGLLAAACGSQPASSGSSSSGSAPAAAASAPAGSDYGSGYGSATPAPAAGATAIRAGSVTVDGRPETVLVDSRGLTLYYFTPDKGGKVTCTGGCAQAWPPLKLTAGATPPQTPGGLTGSIATVTSPDGGQQITFNGFPVYAYAGDSAPGQVNGHALNGKWFEVTSSTPQA